MKAIKILGFLLVLMLTSSCKRDCLLKYQFDFVVTWKGDFSLKMPIIKEFSNKEEFPIDEAFAEVSEKASKMFYGVPIKSIELPEEPTFIRKACF